ncbi:hypothetical protein [Ktedonobacter racemifer]|uniref:PD-(D/E)XK endonuclease-like domain-containing protein n=1 Tax=Ktedonobacter racemifer DSM 44963 TaxID=485913 RepID=D6U8L4_KTERA|nr:hypothetical protein [Ktedonobacter racemifer]EFH80225.1 conserved hypothetical protein [Ktedonobacter racemifer DSM 44963]
MSLTSFIAEPDVKAKLRETFPYIRFQLEQKPVMNALTNHYALIGTAFDYLMRWYLQKRYTHAKDKPWVAEIAAIKQYDQIAALYNTQTAKKAVKFVLEAKQHHKQFLADGVLTDNVIISAILLAQIDSFFRAEKLYEPFGSIDPHDIQDLRQLVSIIPTADFPSHSLCLLDPTFGSSLLVHGADVDLVVDHAIIDIKTVKTLQMKREYIDQLLGYYTLYRLGGINGAPADHTITHLGIYFSRHGYLYTFPVSLFIDEIKYTPFLAWFEHRAKQLFGPY